MSTSEIQPIHVPLPLRDLLKRTHLLAPLIDIKNCLQHVAVEPKVIQELRPLAQSLEWELARLYWGRMGVDAFARSEVPFLINNDGQVSEDAAVLFYAYCLEAIDLPEVLTILEIGAGTGLFARFFLDAFAAICRQEEADFYDRLIYYVTDGSRRTVAQWQERDLFETHAGRCVLAVADAASPSFIKTLEGEVRECREVRAIFCNYLLDVLPASIVRRGPAGPEQLLVRTGLLDDPAIVSQYTRLSLGEIRRLVESEVPEERERLLPLLPVLDLETRFAELSEGSLPFLEEALAWGEGLESVLLNHGAFAALDACFAILHANGFLLLNDYGPVRREEVATQSILQRFGGSAAQGINFPLLDHYGQQRSLRVIAPPEDEDKPIHTRLLARQDLPGTQTALASRFAKEAYEYRQRPREEAWRHTAAGRKSEALEAYKNALEVDPRNWSLIGEVAEFVGLQLRDFTAGLELAQAALERNPWYSPWLWNVLGDCLFCLERHDDAHEAYLQAERIDPKDPRTHLNLAYTLAQRGEFTAALHAIAQALGNDTHGQYRERLIEKQQQILLASSTRWLGEQERLARRAARFQ